MSATYARVTPSLPCGNPNASRMNERPVQLTWTDGHVTRTDGYVDNPALTQLMAPLRVVATWVANIELSATTIVMNID